MIELDTLLGDMIELLLGVNDLLHSGVNDMDDIYPLFRF